METDDAARRENFFERLYEHFNARDMEALLAAMHPDVMWANGMEGGHVHGREGVRDFLDTAVGDHRSACGADGVFDGPGDKVVVEVHATVRDLQGAVLVDHMVGHIFTIENGLIITELRHSRGLKQHEHEHEPHRRRPTQPRSAGS